MAIVKNINKLRQKAIPVAADNISAAMSRLISRTIFIRKGAVGFAGSQVGLREHVFCALIADKWRFFANAVVIRKSWRKSKEYEGCLSLPNKEYLVKRHNKIKIKYQNAQGEFMTEEFTGYEARIVQHELDHLNGVLVCDKK
jgi:peptide deformylase